MNNVHLNTRLTKIKRKFIFILINDVLRWIKKKYEDKYPSNIDYKASGYRRNNGNILGEYDFHTHKIHLYYKNIKTVRELIETVLHEFKHSMQKEHRYNYLSSKFEYDNHPHELAARNFANRYYKNCWNEIKINFKSLVV